MNEFLQIIPIKFLPASCGLIVLIVGYFKLWKLRRTEYPESVGIFGTWLIGIIGLLFGIFGHILSTIRTFDFISFAGDMNASILSEGIKQSYESSLVGFGVLIISLIVWGILKGVKQKKIFLKTID